MLSESYLGPKLWHFGMVLESMVLRYFSILRPFIMYVLQLVCLRAYLCVSQLVYYLLTLVSDIWR
jgi:hypothetical protein